MISHPINGECQGLPVEPAKKSALELYSASEHANSCDSAKQASRSPYCWGDSKRHRLALQKPAYLFAMSPSEPAFASSAFPRFHRHDSPRSSHGALSLDGLPMQRHSLRRTPYASTGPRLDKAARTSISVCHGPSCSQSCGGKHLYEALMLVMRPGAPRVDDESGHAPEVLPCACLGHCSTKAANIGIVFPGKPPLVANEIGSVADALAVIRKEDGGSFSESNSMLEAVLSKERGNREMSQGNPSEAVKNYSISVSLLCASDTVQQLTVVAKESYTKFLAGVLSNRSAAYGELGEWENALSDADSAVDTDPGAAAAWTRKAEAEERLQRRESAARSYEVAARLESSKEKKRALTNRAKKAARKSWLPF